MKETKKISHVGFQRWEGSVGEGVAERAVGRGDDLLGPLEKSCFVSNPGSASLSLWRWFCLSAK